MLSFESLLLLPRAYNTSRISMLVDGHLVPLPWFYPMFTISSKAVHGQDWLTARVCLCSYSFLLMTSPKSLLHCGRPEIWYFIGLQLKVKPSDLNAIKADNSSVGDKLASVINTRLNSEPCTRKELYDALRDPTVGMAAEAEKLAAKLRSSECSPVEFYSRIVLIVFMILDVLGISCQSPLPLGKNNSRFLSHSMQKVHKMWLIINQKAHKMWLIINLIQPLMLQKQMVSCRKIIYS